jgi:membrane associated rhomboid family serine protease
MLPLADTAKQRRPAVVTGVLIAANIAAFGWELWVGNAAGPRVLAGFVMDHSLVARRLIEHASDERQWLTLLPHLFLHGSVGHLLGNLWFLWIFGGPVENRIGPLGFLGFYLVAGVAAAAAQIAVDPGAGMPMLGASGAISGVLGAYLILFPKAWVWSLVPWIVPIVPVPAVVFLVLWFLAQTLYGSAAIAAGVSGGVAWWAHVGGFATGALLIASARRSGLVRARS